MSRMEEIIPLIKKTVETNEFGLPINGTSMNPLLHKNDIVYLVAPSNIKKNDCILYQRIDGSYVFHRIYKMKKNYYILVGDNQTKLEYPIYPNQVIAKMIAYKKKNKRYSINRFGYRLYVFFWHSFLIRRIFFLGRRVLSKIKRS